MLVEVVWKIAVVCFSFVDVAVGVSVIVVKNLAGNVKEFFSINEGVAGIKIERPGLCININFQC